MPRSARLKEKEKRTVRSERNRSRAHDIARRGEAHSCSKPDCERPARHRGSLCESHYGDNVIDKEQLPLIYQGCPQFVLSYDRHRIRWARYGWEIATWIDQHLELSPPDSHRDKRLPEILVVLSWKNAADDGLHELKTLDGKPNLSTLIVEKSKTLFATHHIELSAATVTPDQVRRAINNWLVKTFAREWRIVSSAFSPTDFPHGSIHTFEPDPDDSFDPLHALPPVQSPCFLSGALCTVKWCSYLAYMHPLCTACCKRKFKVEVKRSTKAPGLGLFATSRLKGKGVFPLPEVTQLPDTVQDDEEIINFCTLAEYIDEKECKSFHQCASHLRLLSCRRSIYD